VREAASLRALVTLGPDSVVAAAMADLAAIAPSTRRDRIAAAMRRAKRVVALATAVADIGGIWPLERVTAVLSDLAEATLSLAMAHLLRAAHDAGELRLPDPSDPPPGSGFPALGTGKPGARALSHWSQLDLSLLYDPAAAIYTEASDGHDGRLHVAHRARLVSLMEARAPMATYSAPTCGCAPIRP
jgi:glutamate-ammonia-ligase adenylyltransferase